MRLSQVMAEFAIKLNANNIPPEVIDKARSCLLNGYGIALGCRNTPYAPVARAAVIAMHGERQNLAATLLGDGRKTNVAGAAMANAALFHGRAQEDTCGAAHLGAIMIPLLTAMIEADHYPLDRLLPALITGYELGGLLEKAYAGQTTPSGFRASPLYGTIAASAAAAKLMNLPVNQFEAALANAASFTGGILQSFVDGTDEWRYQVGLAAQTGYTAAQLAKAGSTSAPHAFEGSAGFIKAFAKQECDVDALAKKLGTEWSTLRVTFKPYPVCAFNQTPVIAALDLRERLESEGVEIGNVKCINVHMNPYETGYAGMDSKGPFSSISGTLMSIPFCIANTFIYGAPDIQRMTKFDDNAITTLMERINLIPDESIDKLSCAIELFVSEKEPVVHHRVMTYADYAYSRPDVANLIRRVGLETEVQEDVFITLEKFVESPESSDISELVACFQSPYSKL